MGQRRRAQPLIRGAMPRSRRGEKASACSAASPIRRSSSLASSSRSSRRLLLLIARTAGPRSRRACGPAPGRRHPARASRSRRRRRSHVQPIAISGEMPRRPWIRPFKVCRVTPHLRRLGRPGAGGGLHAVAPHPPTPVVASFHQPAKRTAQPPSRPASPHPVKRAIRGPFARPCTRACPCAPTEGWVCVCVQPI